MMKRISLFLIFLLLIFTLLSCNSSNINDNNDDSISNKDNYTKEFPYLPNYKEAMELVDFKEGEGEEVDIATYSVQGATPEEFLSTYEQLLIENEWENTFDNKPVSINMAKEDHIAIIITPPIEEGEDLIVMIYSK